MAPKAWSASEVRAIARRTVEGRKLTFSARGEYLRALVETAQAELVGGKSGPKTQWAAVKNVHKQFYAVVYEAVTTDDIAHKTGLPPLEKRKRSLERNRRTNFARSAYGTIRRWLRAPGHDLTALNARKVTKSQLLAEAPPTRKHALTPQRVNARAGKLINQLLGFAKMVAKADEAQAKHVLNEAVARLTKQLGLAGITTDAHVAAKEHRPLRLAGTVFVPTELKRPHV